MKTHLFDQSLLMKVDDIEYFKNLLSTTFKFRNFKGNKILFIKSINTLHTLYHYEGERSITYTVYT